jgi:O-antigen ligase
LIKAIFYFGLTLIGIVAALFSPMAGAIAAIESYLLNPNGLALDFQFRYQLWVTIAFIVGCLLHRPRPLEKVGREGILIKSLWAFTAIAALSSLWAVYSASEALDETSDLFKRVLVSSLLVLVIRNEKALSGILMACIVGVWHASVLHVLGPRLGYVPTASAREDGVLPQGQMSVLILFVPLLVVLIASGSRWERRVSLCALPFVIDSIVNTYMRAGFVALAVEGALLLLLLPRRITLRLLPGLALGLGLFFFMFTPREYWRWMDTIGTPTQEGSANSRFAIADASIRMFLDYPMGVGYRNYRNVSPRYLDAGYLTNGKRSAHNSFFTVLCETGILGLLAWFTAFGGAAWTLRRIRRKADRSRPHRIEVYAMGLEIGLYGWFAAGIFHDIHNVDPAYWFVAISVAIARLRAQSQSELEAPADLVTAAADRVGLTLESVPSGV